MKDCSINKIDLDIIEKENESKKATFYICLNLNNNEEDQSSLANNEEEKKIMETMNATGMLTKNSNQEDQPQSKLKRK